MRFAIGLALLHGQAAEPEILGRGVAHGPFAGPFGGSISVRRLAFFSMAETLARASGLISLAEGWGGRGWPTGMILGRCG